jgi:diguanylate cyclase (GGDEF)-like protein
MRIAREDRLLRWSSCFAVSATGESAEITDSWNAHQTYGRYDEWHDPVTGLPRPRCFLEHLERLLAKPDRLPRSLAMLLLEVADFDRLRAQLGQQWCDELLRTIAERLHEEVPEPNLVTRLRGGAFAIVLHDLGPEVAPDALAGRLLERASEPCPSGDRRLRWGVVGALAVPGDRGETAMQLFDRATRALDRARLRLAGPHRGDPRPD